jgi:hypothetical protein
MMVGCFFVMTQSALFALHQQWESWEAKERAEIGGRSEGGVGGSAMELALVAVGCEGTFAKL